MKKRLALLLVCVFCITVAFSGCDLFALDTNKYLSQPVASIQYNSESGGKTITITKKELIEVYNSNASTLKEKGYTGEKAVNELVQYLIKQKITLNEVEYLMSTAGGNKIALTNADINDMYTSTYQNMTSLIADYEKEVIEDFKLTTTPTINNDTSTTAKTYTPYDKQAVLTKNGQGEWIIEINNEEDRVNETLICAQNEIVNKVIIEITAKINANTNNVLKEAQKRYIADLINYEKGQNLSKIDSEVWQREVNRVFTNIQKNKYLELYEDYLQSTQFTENNVQYSPITATKVLKYYETQMLTSYNKYFEDIATYKTDILSSRANVNYILNSDDSNELGDYFYVSHLLVKFTEKQTADLKDLEAIYNQNPYDVDKYQDARNAIINATKVKENGVETDKTVTQLLQELQTMSTSQRLAAFQNYIYCYNEDTGNQNAEFDYIVGTEDSKMVESFNEASRELYNDGNGNLGDISGLVESEYGVHIVMYLKPVENLFNISNSTYFSLSSLTGTDLDNVMNKIKNEQLSQFSNKTLFDKIYETLKTDTFEQYKNLNMDDLIKQKNINIYKHPANYSDLL